MNTTIEKRKEKWKNFLDMTKPSPNMILIRHDEYGAKAAELPGEADAIDKQAEWLYAQYNHLTEMAEWLHDDRVPAINGMYCFTGTEIFAEAFGCKVHRREGQAPFALPMVTTSAEAAKIKKPMLASSTLCKYFDVIDAVRRKTGGEGVVKLPDIQSPMGIAALIWNKADLFVAMHEEPEAVKELAEKVQSFLADFFDEWFARYGKDFIAHFPDYYMPYGVTLSDDEIGAVSSKMFKEFFEPGLRFLTERYGALGIHCCAHARHQWENLRGLQNLKLLNLNTGAAHVHDAFDFFKDKCAQWNEWFDADVPFWQAAERLSKGTRCVINVNAETKEEALRLSELLNEKYGKV